MSVPESQFAFPIGSVGVVSGANGNIASHIVNQLLKLGFKVRGTVHDQAKVRGS
jgi:uncharacterized protein YbjT (DUF2867 family)